MQKSHVLLTLAVAGLAACVVTVSLAIPVHADPDVPEIAKTAAAPPVVEAVTQPTGPTGSATGPTGPIEVPGDGGRHERLRSYVLDIMNGWSHAVPKLEVADYGDIASDIAAAVIGEARASETTGHECGLMPSNDGSHRCAWAPPWNSDHAKAVLLAALAYWEGARYAAYPDRYECNDLVWRASPEGKRLMRVWGDCDHGIAMSSFQIHPVVDTSASIYTLCNKTAISSRLGAATCALAIARASVTADGTLASYTGEFTFDGGHPKADLRIDFARRARRKHPWPSSSE